MKLVKPWDIFVEDTFPRTKKSKNLVPANSVALRHFRCNFLAEGFSPCTMMTPCRGTNSIDTSKNS